MRNQMVGTFKQAAALKKMGANIKLARQVRGYSVSVLAYWAGVSRSMIYKIEAGNPAVSIGAVYAILLQLGLEKDFANIAFRKDLSTDMIGKNWRRRQ